jgi:histidinol-phosphatase (PHP family)
LSDDSHGVEQVGLNYSRVLTAVKKAGIEKLVRIKLAGEPAADVLDARFPGVTWTAVSVADVQNAKFWHA